jgi:DNA-binding NarL/FixJ family response regulator
VTGPDPEVTPPAIRIVLADDHPVVREGLRGMLDAEPDLAVVGEASDGIEAVRVARATHPDVVLMDLRMPNQDGVQATAELARVAPGVRVLVLTTYDTDADILRAVEAGATGYLLKDAPRATLADAVRAASRGETVLAPGVAARLMRKVHRDHETLTRRELDVLQAVASGARNAEAAAALGIGEATVKTHMLRIFTKLGVDGRTEAVTRAMELGIIPPPGRDRSNG